MRRTEAMGLRVAGCTLVQIAKQQQISYTTAMRDLKASLKLLTEKWAESVDDYRAITVERGELALKMLYPAVKEKDLASIREWTRTAEMLARVKGVYDVNGAPDTGQVTLNFLIVEAQKNDSRETDQDRSPAQADRLPAIASA